MKLTHALAASGLSLLATTAGAAKWVQYDVYGAGYYGSSDVTTDPAIEESGRAWMHAVIFADVEASEDDEPTYLNDWIYYGGSKTFTGYYLGGVDGYVSARANGGSITFTNDWTDGDCGHYYCYNWVINLNFAPGSFNTLSDKLPHVIGGDFTFYASAHWWSMGAGGEALKITSTAVTEPGEAGLYLQPVPEPATWGMMIGGMAFVGWALRRRKVSVSFG